MKYQYIKQTIKSLQNEIKALTKDDLRDPYNAYPEYVQITQQIQDLMRKRDVIRDKYGDEVYNQRRIRSARIKELKAEIQKIKSSKFEIPANVSDWFYREYCKGSSFGYGSDRNQIKIVWLSEDQRFAIVTNKGGSGWVGRGTFAYHQSSSWVIVVDGEGRNFYNKQSQCHEYNEFMRIEGRLTKELKQKMIDYIANELSEKI